jgi:site-specific recombinase XerD
MSPLQESVLLEMRLRGFSPCTHESYIYALKQLCRFYMRPLETLSCHEVQRFLDDIITVRKLAWATVNVYFSACRFLYEQVLRRAPHEFSIPPRGRSRTRPGVFSPEETMRLIETPRNVKHRALLSLVYGSGLRVSEVVLVQPVDVDRGRMMLKVTGNPKKEKDLPAAEFIQRFLYHILPDGFVKIRYFGWLSPTRKKTTLAAIRTAMSVPAPALSAAEGPQALPEESPVERILRLTGVDVRRCPICGESALVYVGRLAPTSARAPPCA